MNRCQRCGSWAKKTIGQGLCYACAIKIKSDVAPEFLVELGKYWERRLLEGRRKDWN